jgi:hypothetical protein
MGCAFRDPRGRLVFADGVMENSVVEFDGISQIRFPANAAFATTG